MPCADARGALSPPPRGPPAGDVRAADAGLGAARSPQLVSSIVAERVSHLGSGSPPLSPPSPGAGSFRTPPRGTPRSRAASETCGSPRATRGFPPAAQRSPGSPASALPLGGDAWGVWRVGRRPPKARALPHALPSHVGPPGLRGSACLLCRRTC